MLKYVYLILSNKASIINKKAQDYVQIVFRYHYMKKERTIYVCVSVCQCIYIYQLLYAFLVYVRHIHIIALILIFYFTDSKPEKHVLLRFLSSVTAKWQEIGDLLGVKSDTIEMLYNSNFSDQMKMSKMLQSWLDNEPTPVTWNNFITVIEGPLQMKSLAIEIRQFIGIESGQILY